MMPRRRTVADIGEFGLIERIAAIVGETAAAIGIGDDTAVIDQPGPDFLLATVDMLVEGVHFPAGAPAFDLGRRALAVNLSDIAAMGGTPTFALTSIALPPGTDLRWLEDLYRGMAAEAQEFDAGIVGGNVTRTPGPLSLDVIQLGRVPKDQVVTRSGARVGDVLAVTGVLGKEAAARLIAARSEDPAAVRAVSVPEPRIGAGRSLAAAHLAHAMIDLSDGLGSDVHHLADRSSVGAVIYEANLPVSVRAREVGGRIGTDPHDLALYGGEDYELLVAVPEDRLPEATAVLGHLPLYTVGTILPAEHGVLIERIGGRRDPLQPRGWRHF